MTSIIQRLRQSASGMVGIAVISTTVSVLGYKYYWKPKQLRQERNEAQALADYIFEFENK